jgi:hypothetical protein
MNAAALFTKTARKVMPLSTAAATEPVEFSGIVQGT